MSVYAENPRAILSACMASQRRAEEISEEVARAIAGQWHAGQGSAFYAFASSGHYDRSALLAELSEIIGRSYSGLSADDRLPLDMIGTYLIGRHEGHFSRLGGTYWCDTCDSPYCDLA